ncbi:MAG TPA: amidohydrolase family protein, partial [Anaerolineaceae bacterium]|nr:amidohydrolase family protein [Anaerolineaceae bacterium]
MKTLIKGGTLITASETFQADILIEGEKIAAIADNLPVPADCIVYQAEGKLVMPGGVDVHVHLDLPMSNTVSSDDHYTGTKAAAFGATTTVIDFVSQDEAPLLLNVQKLRAKAEQKAVVDYSFHMNITRFDDQVAEEIPHLLDEGVASVKVFTAYNNRLRLDDGNIFKVMRIAKEAGLLTMLHAENGDVIDVL